MITGILGLIGCCIGCYALLGNREESADGESIAYNEFTLGLKHMVTMPLGHTLIVGGTGSGKSTCLNYLIPQFLDKGYTVNIIDLKVVEFIDYITKVNTYITKQDDVLSYFEALLGEIQDRLNYMVLNRQKNYIYSPTIVVIDEFQRLCEDKKSKALLFEIIAIARATNIYIVLSCQCPRSEIVDGRIRDNIHNTVIFRCETNASSEVATGVKGDYRGTLLMGFGHGLLKHKGEYSEFN